MLTFFRRIRKGLLGEGATRPTGSSGRASKYVLYAVGEITLVVIGILIALQINNWNEERKDRIKEREVLQNLEESLENSIRKLEAHIYTNDFGSLSSDIIISIIDNNLAYNDSLNQYFGWALNIGDPGALVSLEGYEYLKHIGVDIIKSNDLKKEIINLFEETFQVSFGRRDRTENYNNEIVKLRQRYLLRLNNFNFAPFDFDNLIKDKYFYSWLFTIKNTRNWVKASHIESLSETQRVLQLIKDELGESE